MGLFGWFRKSNQAPSDPEPSDYTHPTLGTMYMDTDSSWSAEEAVTPLAGQPISVSLEGTEAGPDGQALAGYGHIVENWATIFVETGIQEAFFELYAAYADSGDAQAQVGSPSEVWSTAVVSSLDVASPDTFTITVTFTWQHSKDGHIITAEVEDGFCQGCTVDG
jgi:hypothetical protein